MSTRLPSGEKAASYTDTRDGGAPWVPPLTGGSASCVPPSPPGWGAQVQPATAAAQRNRVRCFIRAPPEGRCCKFSLHTERRLSRRRVPLIRFGQRPDPLAGGGVPEPDLDALGGAGVFAARRQRQPPVRGQGVGSRPVPLQRHPAQLLAGGHAPAAEREVLVQGEHA